ncbi:MAG: RNA polymerase alpha subunit C-terminal domain-containing protein [Balneolales bacterium]
MLQFGLGRSLVGEDDFVVHYLSKESYKPSLGGEMKEQHDHTKIKKTCTFGHSFNKSSDCPTCPTCEKLKEPESGFLALLSNPARNALLHHGIDTILKLSNYTEKDILKIHGIGKASLPIFRKSLEEQSLTFNHSDEIKPKKK